VARLAAKQQAGVVSFGRYITAHGPSMARLHSVARAILARLVFLNDKACIYRAGDKVSIVLVRK